MKSKDVIALCKAKDVKVIDFKFCDIHGSWQHFSTSVNELTESVFEDGLGFDASSIQGWAAIEASDMLAMPDPTTACIDPFIDACTLSIICDVQDPISRKPYDRSPRGIAKRAESYLKETGIADTVYFGPEAEFFIFDEARYDYQNNQAFFSIESSEGIWGSGKNEAPNLGHKIGHKCGYLPVPPVDKTMDIRNEMMLCMMDLGINVERQHHEVATAGQAEIDVVFDSLLNMGDTMCLYKYIVKNVAHKHGKTATFMPKPIFGDNGSGMHTHISLWKDGETLMAGDKYSGFSELGLYFIGGLLKHANALCALCNPTTNSYKRLIPGYEAPVTLAYSARNRSAICRIPTYSDKPSSKRVEFRCPDASANPYLAFSALMMAGLDGIQNKIDPGAPVDKNLYDLTEVEKKGLKHIPDSLQGALDALDKDRSFLTQGGVFTNDFIDNFISLKHEESDALRLRPHPYEYMMYYSV